MSPLADTIASVIKTALDQHGQICIVRRRNETFDENAGGWTESSPPTDHVCRFIPEEFSEFIQAQPAFRAGESKIYIAADDIPITPREGSKTNRADLVYFGDWATETAATVATATSHGRIESVEKTARYLNKQIAWGPIRVMAGAT